jgi:predicted aspartyl protease
VSFPFDPRQGLIVVWTELSGPDGRVRLRLALDTGASGTMINVGHLVAIGYDPALSPERIQVTTGSGVEFVPRVQVTRLKALGQERVAFPILSHTLPPSAGIDGLLGLDFCREHRLEVDFVRGLVSLT